MASYNNRNWKKYEEIDDFDYLLNRNSVKEKILKISQKRMSVRTGRWNHYNLLDNGDSEVNRGSVVENKKPSRVCNKTINISSLFTNRMNSFLDLFQIILI